MLKACFFLVNPRARGRPGSPCRRNVSFGVRAGLEPPLRRCPPRPFWTPFGPFHFLGTPLWEPLGAKRWRLMLAGALFAEGTLASIKPTLATLRAPFFAFGKVETRFWEPSGAQSEVTEGFRLRFASAIFRSRCFSFVFGAYVIPLVKRTLGPWMAPKRPFQKSRNAFLEVSGAKVEATGGLRAPLERPTAAPGPPGVAEMLPWDPFGLPWSLLAQCILT